MKIQINPATGKIELKPKTSGGGGSGTTWYTGHGLPSPSLGINGDFYLDLDTGNIYQKIGGVWIFQGMLTAGADNFSYRIINSDIIVIIPLEQQMILVGDLQLNGILINNGEVVLLNL